MCITSAVCSLSITQLTNKGMDPRTQSLKEYSGTSDNRLSLLREPPQCGPDAAVPNYSLLFSNLHIVETSLLQITDTEVMPQCIKSIQISP